VIALPAHLDDGTAVRLLDRELSTGEHAAILGHLSGCAACASRVNELAAVSEGVRRILNRATLAHAIPEARRRRGLGFAPRLRRPLRSVPFAIAASAAVVAAALPVVRGRLAPAAVEGARIAGTTVPGAAAGRVVPVLEFEPGGPTLSVEVVGRATGGTLVLAMHDGHRVLLEADRPPARAIWVAPGVLRLAPPRLPVDYRILVPGSVRLVRVSIDGARLETVSALRLGRGAVSVALP
jgi:hypothetical protein